jgi:hypothetical protein
LDTSDAISGDSAAEQEDLALVLKRLVNRESSTRKTRESRHRLANSPLTREYLEAGLRLLAGQFRPAAPAPGDRDDEVAEPSPFFSWLSAQKIIDEVTRGGKLRGNQGTFEDRWPYRGYYIEDLLAYALWSRHWSARAAVAQNASESLAGEPDLVEIVHEAARREYLAARSSPSARIWLIAQTIADRYPEIRADLRGTSRAMDAHWTAVYKQAFDLWDLRLRPGITFEWLAFVVAACLVGLELRLNSTELDDDAKRAMLGEAILVVLAGCIDTGDGKSVAELLRGLTAPDN